MSRPDRRFDQCCLALRTDPEGFADHLRQRPLQQQARDQYQRNGHQRHYDDQTADPPDDEQVKHHERQVDHRCDGGGCQEFAERFEFGQAVGEAADRLWAGFQSYAKDFFVDQGGQCDVDFLAGNIDKIAAQAAHEEIEAVHDPGSDCQHPQGFKGLVRHYPVVHVHRKQWHDQCEDVDQE